jgi:hypothetical protein
MKYYDEGFACNLSFVSRGFHDAKVKRGKEYIRSRDVI